MKINVTIWIAILLIILAFFGYKLVQVINEQGEEDKIYKNCLDDYADTYCQSLNYDHADYWGNGFNPNQYFKCHDGRTYGEVGKFVANESEKEDCKEIAYANSGGQEQ